MNSQTRRDIRFGLTALALSGLLFTVATIVRGPMSGLGVESLVRDGASPNWAMGWAIGVVGSVLMFFGFVGLYRYLTYPADSRIAFLAAVLSATAIALFIGPASFMAFNMPVVSNLHQQGNHEVLAVFQAIFNDPLGRVRGIASAVGYVLGPILFAVAITRDGRLPRWTGILFALSFALTAYPVYFPAELLGSVLLLISSSWIAGKGWQESVLQQGKSRIN